jgi:hypothetical protein
MKSFLLPLGFFFAIITYLALTGLDNAALWDDEAVTAVFARNFLRTGRFTAWDGRNLFSVRDGTLLDENLTSRESPLGYFAAAASFALFGETTWAARFPFVIAGLAALLTLFFILRLEFPLYPKIPWAGFFTMGFSVIFLMNIRQCRYYSLALLFSLLCYLSYQKTLRSRSVYPFLLMPVFAALVFFSNVLLGASFLLALGLSHLFFNRLKWDRSQWGKFGLSAFILAILIVPYSISQKIWYRPDFEAYAFSGFPWYVRRLFLILANFRELDTINVLPLGLLAICLFSLRGASKEVSRPALFFITVCFLNLIGIALFSPKHMRSIREWADVRYLIVCLPFAAGFIAASLSRILEGKRGVLAALVILVHASSNLFSVMDSTQEGWRWLLPDYVKEIHQPYPTPNAALTAFVKARVKKDEQVFVYEPFYSYPLHFYAGDWIKMCCSGEATPDWIFFVGKGSLDKGILKDFSKRIRNTPPLAGRTYAFLGRISVYPEQTQRPELFVHSFGPPSPLPEDGIFVYHLEPIGKKREKNERFKFQG